MTLPSINVAPDAGRGNLTPIRPTLFPLGEGFGAAEKVRDRLLSPIIMESASTLSEESSHDQVPSPHRMLNAMSQASQTQTQSSLQEMKRSGSASNLPQQELTIAETLRIMDVAREMRDQRETAEEMFVRDDLRSKLRDKLVRTAQLSGDNVTEAEIEAAIAQYFETLHKYNDPEGGFKRFVAHCWIWRGRLMAGVAAVATVVGSYWFLFS